MKHEAARVRIHPLDAWVPTLAPWLRRIDVLPVIFFASGTAALVYQIAWQRLLFVSFGVDIESVTIVVSTFMLGLGIGALAGGWVADRFPGRLLVAFALCELGIGLFGFSSAPLIRAAGAAFVEASRPVTASVNFLLLLVPTTLMGATLPMLVADTVRRRGGIGVSVGTLYFVNTLGAAFGALMLGTLLVRYDLLTAIRVAAVTNVAIACAGALLARHRR